MRIEELLRRLLAVNTQNSRNSQNSQNSQNSSNSQNSENSQNSQNTQNAQNITNSENSGNGQNSENGQNSQDSDSEDGGSNNGGREGTRSKFLYYGAMVKRSRPVRHRNSKWFMSYGEWGGTVYPVWAHGAGYIFSSEIAKFIKEEYDSGKLEMFRLEDIGMGIWLEKLSQLSKNVLFVDDQDLVFDGCRNGFVIAHYQRPESMKCLWKHLEAGNGARCCDI